MRIKSETPAVGPGLDEVQIRRFWLRRKDGDDATFDGDDATFEA
jgi:hypothetical protein